MQRSTRQKGLLIFWLAMACCLMSAGLAWAAPLTLTEKDSGKTLTVPVGQTLVVDLRLGAGQYVLVPEFDPAVLALVGQSIQSTSGSQGASSRVVYEFLVQQGGRTELVISARGSENKESKPEPLLKVKIVATGGGLGV